MKLLKNITILRLTDAPAFDEVLSRSEGMGFVPTGPTQTHSSGLVPPRAEGSALVESIGGEWVAKLAIERRAVPATTVKKRLDERLDQIERETGRRPKGKRARELKDEVALQLLPHAFPRRADTVIWVSPRQRLAVIGSTSAGTVDIAITALVELGMRLDLLQTQMNPSTAMAQWLSDGEAPEPFALDRECELKQPYGEKAVVRYARHPLELDEIGEHIRQGKMPTKLAANWSRRVSFLLTEALTLKKLELLDIPELAGTAEDRESAADAFDADVAIVTGELSRLIPDLVDALGGILERDDLASPAAAQADNAEAQAVPA